MSSEFDAWLMEQVAILRAENAEAEARLCETLLALGWDEETTLAWLAGDEAEAQ
jgi:hypothetical protein